MKKSDILKTAKERMDRCQDHDRENRLEDMDDLRKLVGKQWPEEIRRERETENKPCLTMNRLPQFVRQVTGDIRRMNPAINITAADNEATEDTAEILEGLIRQIEYASDASSVYEQTAELAAACSIGWFRVRTDWASDDSFDQEIKVERIRNSFSVYCDPAAEMPTREDAGYLFISEAMDPKDFKAQYPKAKPVDVSYDTETDNMENWHLNERIVVAEYYWKEPVTSELIQLHDGQVLSKDDAEGIPEEMIARTRKVESSKVMWAKISGHEVLEGPIEQPCKNIPVIAVTGEEWHVGDRVHRSGVIRYAKDAQQMYNYWRSAATEAVALQPKAPYIVTAKQIAGLETFWKQANQKNRPYLPYIPDEKAPPPQRATPPVSSTGMLQEVANAAEDMKATTGIYDAGLGNQSNEQSGVAIRQRQIESDTSTSIYSDNMAKAIGTCGRILVDMIPKIYDTSRQIRILGKDDTEKMVPVNQRMIEQGQEVPVNDLRVGKYDVRVSVGPNYSTRRQETAEGMLEFIRSFPQAAQITGDLVAKSMDWPDADQFAERLKKVLPPEVRDNEDLSPEEQQAAMVAQQQAEMQAQKQAAAEEIQFRQEGAKAVKAEADAEKAQVEVAAEQLELAINSGQLNAAIGQIVQQQVVAVLQGLNQQGQNPTF